MVGQRLDGGPRVRSAPGEEGAGGGSGGGAPTRADGGDHVLGASMIDSGCFEFCI